MKNFMSLASCAVSFFFLTTILTACSGGGGGGSSTTPAQPTSVTVTCPNQTTQTAETTELANAKCAKPLLLSAVVAPDFSKVTVITDSVLDHGVITLKVGSLTDIPGTFTKLQTNGFVFTPNQKLQYGVSHDFVAEMTDSLGRKLMVNLSFTPVDQVTPLTCVLPAVWTTGVNSCVTPVNLQIALEKQLPVGCDTWASQCGRDAVKFLVSPDPKIVLAYFKNANTVFGTTGLWNLIPINVVDGSLAGPDISGGSVQEIDWVYVLIKGGVSSIIAHVKESETTGSCVQYLFDANHNWISQPVACPTIP